MSDGLGLIIECLVAVLLMATIGYCMLLNRRLKLLRADEAALRATIGELVTATEIAERAIAGLRITARDCEAGLGERLVRAERVAAELDRKLAAAQGVVVHTAPAAAAGGGEGKKPQVQDPRAIASAAHAFAERLRNKMLGIAA